jgi:hypothetical protein
VHDVTDIVTNVVTRHGTHVLADGGITTTTNRYAKMMTMIVFLSFSPHQ